MIKRLKFDLEDLVNEMLDKLPEEVFKSNSTTFLDPEIGGGQFVAAIEERLRKYGHSDINISKRVFGITENRIRLNYATNTYKIVGTYSVEDFLTKDFKNMKFDVIIGNPPYQRPTAKRFKLWPEFLSQALSMSKNYVCFVTPDVFVSGRNKLAKQVRMLINPYFLEYVNMDANKYFTVGESICSYQISKNDKNKTSFIFNGETEEHLFQDTPIVLDKELLKVYNILDKVQSSNFERIKLIRAIGSKFLHRDDFSEEPKEGYSTVGIASHSKTVYSSTEFLEFKGPKIIFNNSGYYYKPNNPKYLRKGNSEIALGNAYQLNFETMTEVDNAFSFFTTKLIRYCVDKDKTSGFNEPSLKKLPYVDFSKKWNDSEVYQLFNLTQEEIALIESTVVQ